MLYNINTLTKLFCSFILSIVLFGCVQTKTTTTKVEPKPKATFEKIIYHTTGCFGTCPAYHLQINADKTFNLYSEKIFKDSGSRPFEVDSSRMGYFKGTLSDSIYRQISTELSRLKIDTLTFPDVQCCDGPVKTLIVYYNGKRKFLRSMTPPKETRTLFSIFHSIFEGEKTKSTENFEIENTK